MGDTRREFSRRSDRIEELVRRLETEGDPAIRATAQELLEAVIELHGIALERILEAVAAADRGQAQLEKIAADDLVSGVLSLHGLHPIPLEVRVTDAIEKSRGRLKSHGGNVELISIDGAEVHVKLQGACGTCGSSTETLKSTIEGAIYDAAPEIAAVIAETAPAAPQLVTLRAS
jgi:Fe-S cluster biogenesis protein NfuA